MIVPHAALASVQEDLIALREYGRLSITNLGVLYLDDISSAIRRACRVEVFFHHQALPGSAQDAVNQLIVIVKVLGNVENQVESTESSRTLCTNAIQIERVEYFSKVW